MLGQFKFGMDPTGSDHTNSYFVKMTRLDWLLNELAPHVKCFNEEAKKGLKGIIETLLNKLPDLHIDQKVVQACGAKTTCGSERNGTPPLAVNGLSVPEEDNLPGDERVGHNSSNSEEENQSEEGMVKYMREQSDKYCDLNKVVEAFELQVSLHLQ